MFIVKVGNYMNFCSKCGTKLNGDEINCNNCNFEIKKDINDLSNSNENDMKTQNKSKVTGIISLILALIPYLLFIFCLIASGGSLSEADDGAVWWLFVMYAPFSIPIAITSYICAVVSSKNKKNKLATISIILFYIPLCICLIFAIILLFGVLGKL